jgi:hypothetical protein
MFEAQVLVPVIVVLLVGFGMLLAYSIDAISKLRSENLESKINRKAYEACGKLLNSTEQNMYRLLKEWYSEAWEIFVQVDMGSLIKVSKNADDFYNTLEDLDKSIDFVIVNRNTFHPALAIELNGLSHDQNTRIIRDKFIGRIFLNCNIPYLFIKPIHLAKPEDLKKLIDEKLSLSAL